MAKPITPDMVYRLVTVGGPSLSPDGSRLAFVRSRTDKASMETHSQVMMVSLTNGEVAAFTGGDSDTTPRFSPDGASLAFLRPDTKGRKQLWVMPTSGGEAEQATRVPGGVTEYAWSPDSRRIALVSDVDPDRQPESHDNRKALPRVRVVRRVRYRADTIGWRGDAFRHLFILDVGSSETRQLTHGEGEDSSQAWSPEGSRIAFVSDRRPDRDFVSATEAYVVPAQGGEPEMWSQGLTTVAALTWSPDGERLAVLGSDDPEVSALWQAWVFVIQPGQKPVRLTDDAVKPAAGYAPIVAPPEVCWTLDGRIRCLADARGESYLYEVHAGGEGARRIAGGGGQLGAVSFDAGGKQAAVVMVSPSSPGDIHLFDLETGSARRLTDYNRQYLDAQPPARLEKSSLSRDGMTVEYRLLLPLDFDESRRYPLVLDIHGGPHGAFYDAFNPIQQVLSTHGYIVLAVNPRGSSTYGVEFVKAVLSDWGGEDYRDIMAAVDEVCSRPYVDASRLGVTGYSYGGFMSSWIVGHDTRFRAAVVGAPVTNLLTFYGTSDIGVSFGEIQMGGGWMDSLDTYLEHSPLTYARHVETPVLLLHGEDDVRCPIDQSEQYFVALKRLGKEVELVRFPGCSHAMLRSGHPKMREEYLSRTLAWFDKHLRPGESPKAATN